MAGISSTALIEMIISDPPRIHPGAPIGVWSTDADCYRFLAERAVPGARTLETGCGISTIVLAASGSDHTCVTLGQNEADGIVAWCRDHNVDVPNLRFAVGPSTDVLPTLERSPLDLVFIDGGHQFPTPVIDWFYTAPRVRMGGVIVLDDLQLPAPRLVADYMSARPSVVRTFRADAEVGRVPGSRRGRAHAWRQSARAAGSRRSSRTARAPDGSRAATSHAT